MLSMFIATNFFTFAIPAIKVNNNENVVKNSYNILTVDDDGNDYPDADYETITEAIENSGEYQIINVYPGEYHENLLISGNRLNYLNLIGMNPETTIINGDRNGNVIEIKSNGVIISGFTIINSKSDSSGIYIKEEADYTEINGNNKIKENFGNGITIDGRYTEIKECEIKNNKKTGIYISGQATFSFILNKTKITGNLGDGITNYGSYLKIIECEIKNNQGSGIYVDIDSWATDIYHNDFISNRIQLGGNPSRQNTCYLDDGWSGNFWSDYSGPDNDGDGIGDKSHNGDKYPLMRSWFDNVGPSKPTELSGLTFGYMGKPVILTTGGSYDPDGKKVRYEFVTENTYDTTNTNYVTNYESVSIGHIMEDSDPHNLPKECKRTVKVRAVDTYGYKSEFCDKKITITLRNPISTLPIPSKPEGVSHPKVNEKYIYKTEVTVNEGNVISYIWEFNDGTQEITEENKIEHIWTESGRNRWVRVKIKDIYDFESFWSEKLDVTVQKTRIKSSFNSLNQLITKLIEKSILLEKILTH